MRPVDHFLSQLDKLERAVQIDEDRLVQDFVSLCAPVTGVPAAEDLCCSLLDRLRNSAPPPLRKLGFAAAFLLGEFDDTMSLDQEDWEDIRETLEEIAGEMNLETLTTLMGELLSRGKLT
jgi:hypothetical protein